MTQEELNKIIENHQHWLNQDCDGWETMRANLSGCDLRKNNLAGAYLAECNLTGAYLAGAYNIPFIPMACPDTGSFIGWKKANGYIKNVIVKLLIPEDAKRSSATVSSHGGR